MLCLWDHHSAEKPFVRAPKQRIIEHHLPRPCT